MIYNNDKNKVWICGQNVLNGVNWEFQGVFDSEDRAVKACRNKNYFIAPMIMNEEQPDESIEWNGAYFPII